MVEQDSSMQGQMPGQMQNPMQGPSPFGQEIANASTQQDSGDSRVDERSQIASLISDLDRRLRILEERYSNLRKKIQLTDSNLIESERSFGKELRTFNNELLELKRSTVDFDDKVSIFASEMSNMAQKSDLKIVEKYLALWDPQMYVTRRELKEYLNNRPKENKQIDGEDRTRKR